MTTPRYNLAIETTSRRGALALGCDDALIEMVALPEQRRHNVGLMPGIERLCAAHDVQPTDLAEVYLSLGPGSFTGLRVAIAAAKMLAMARGIRLVGVPTLDVVAQNAPAEHACTAVCLNLKRSTMYCAVYQRDNEAQRLVLPAELRTMEELLQQAPRPLALLGEMLPERAEADEAQVTRLAADLAVPRAEAVWQLGRAKAKRGEYDDPLTLEPLYVRRPEAVELWEAREQESTPSPAPGKGRGGRTTNSINQ